MKESFVYIMANDRPTLYVGVTTDIKKRVYQHKQEQIEGFTKSYHLTKLVYLEQHQSIEEAILREKRLKHWNRAWKLRLIQKTNPKLEDLYPTLFD